MTTKGERQSATLCLAVILFVLSLFAPTSECFRLRKTEKRDRRKEAAASAAAAAAAGFQPGRVLFGNIFEKRSGVDAHAKDAAHVPPSSAEDDANYQGDAPGNDLRRSYFCVSQTWLTLTDLSRMCLTRPSNPSSS